MTLPQIKAFLLAITLLYNSQAFARRLPQPGGSVTLDLTPTIEQKFIQAHTQAALLEALPAVGSTSGNRSSSPWTSSFIESIRESENYQTWYLNPKPNQKKALAKAIEQCLRPPKKAEAPWPGRLLSFLGIRARVEQRAQDIALSLSKPVGPLPDLLAGCRFAPMQTTPVGPFTLTKSGSLTPNPKSKVPAALLTKINLAKPSRFAHIRQTRSNASSVNIVVAPIPTVIMLLLSPTVLESDPLQLQQDQGIATFYQHLGIPLLLNIANETYARFAATILPPGIAPALPLLEKPSSKTIPLHLTTLVHNSPTYTILSPEKHPVIRHIDDRLRVIFRHHGARIVSQKTASSRTLGLLRWQPPTLDPGLAILHLATTYKQLFDAPAPAITAALKTKLLSPSLDERLEAALDVQQHWLKTTAIIPLATLTTWYEVHPELKNIRVSTDGVPLLHDAFWSHKP